MLRTYPSRGAITASGNEEIALAPSAVEEEEEQDDDDDDNDDDDESVEWDGRFAGVNAF